MKHRRLYFILSALVIIPGIFSLVKFGLKPSVDFTGGTLLEIKGENLSKESIQKSAEETKVVLNSRQESSGNSVLLRFSELGEEKKEEFIKKTKENSGKELEIIRFETLGPSLGKELLVKTGVGMLLAVAAILVFINSQFKDKTFGICAILAMLHDTLVMFGCFSLLGHFFGAEVDSLFVTAVLTILSFSVHDTVVVYDRIRELKKTNAKLDIEEAADIAVSQTMRRSISNSLTIIFMLLALVFLGGATTKWFAVALLIGTISGTYSSTFVAVPLLVVWKKIKTFRKN
jgi:preprotein translocase subunit SecF